MGDVFKKLEKNIIKTTNKDTALTQQDVEKTLGMTWVSKKGKNQFYTMRKKTKKDGQSADPITRVKPQITLHLPLKYMKKAFIRLGNLGHERIQKFIKIDKIKQLIKKRTNAAGLALLFEYYVYNLFTSKAPIRNRDIPGPKGIMSRSGPEKVDHKAAKDRIKIWSVFHQIKRLILLLFDNTRHWV